MEGVQDSGGCLLLLSGLVSFLETWKKLPSENPGVENLVCGRDLGEGGGWG